VAGLSELFLFFSSLFLLATILSIYFLQYIPLLGWAVGTRTFWILPDHSDLEVNSEFVKLERERGFPFPFQLNRKQNDNASYESSSESLAH
jgi:hypothetical protein